MSAWLVDVPVSYTQELHEARHERDRSYIVAFWVANVLPVWVYLRFRA